MHRFLPEGERFLALPDRLARPEEAGVVVVPFPYERTSSYGAGSRRGPAAILSASHQVEFFDAGLGFEPCERAGGIATLEALDMEGGTGGHAAMECLEPVVSHWLEAGKMVVTLAGEHAGVVGSVRAHTKRLEELTVLQLDAHADLRASYEGDPWNHACAMARVFDFHQDIVQVGIRSEAAEERAFAEKHNIPVFRGEAIGRAERAGEDWVQPIVDACAANVYVTLDCDVLDPAVMPATGTPEPGGLGWLAINDLLARLAARRNVVGFDLCELAPIAGLHYPEFTAAKLAYRFIGRIFGCRDIG